MRTAFVALFLCGNALTVAAQAPKAFDVASVKPIDPMTSYGCGEDLIEYGGGFRIKPLAPNPVGGMPLACLIALAFDVTTREVIGGPLWISTDLFALDARSDTPATRTETLAMLRTLLAERFGLVVRQEPRFMVKKWVLTMARTDGRLGPGIRSAEMACVKMPRNAALAQRQLRAGEPVPCGIASDGRDTRAGGGQPFSQLLFPIRLALGDEVIDRTGLTGLFDFYVSLPRAAAPGQQDPDRASIFTAVQEQLGMKLEREEVARPAVIIERVSRPLPN